MVFYFEPRGFGPGKNDWLIYVGKDKFENEDLISYGLPMDVWFHVDDLSSAHVYLRLPEGGDFQDLPPDTLEDCAQLVKANSIVGSKRATVDIVYTPWSNLKKTASMETGQVSFHDAKLVKKISVTKSNDIVNRLNRTKKELYPDLAQDREAYDRTLRGQRKEAVQAQKKQEKAAKAEAERQKDLRSYKHLMQDDQAAPKPPPAQSFQDYEDDFM
ncbi:hypothetical protein WJX73_000108 [Symbiochloris irregularis]|uniref:NFACT RNA-binding domain-containing protein n=1 Tax=Symbiochloris irregularis TaxID=706552 RepID=A0AAW1P6J2_9CHLO